LGASYFTTTSSYFSSTFSSTFIGSGTGLTSGFGSLTIGACIFCGNGLGTGLISYFCSLMNAGGASF
jgi:hypothetical protein